MRGWPPAAFRFVDDPGAGWEESRACCSSPERPSCFSRLQRRFGFLSKRDAEVRRVYLDVPHSKDPGYSWTGESVGHYENGDTLVVDTGEVVSASGDVHLLW